MKIDNHNQLRSLTERCDKERSSQEQVKNTCNDFEALFIARLLKEMRKTTAEDSDNSGQKYADTFQSLFDWELSRMLARQGSLGIARNLLENIETESDNLQANNVEPGGNAFKRGDFDDLIDKAAASFKLDPGLIRAVITCESDGDPNLVSRRNAKGLMQLMDETARDMGVFDSFDPAQNIYGGTAYLRNMMDSFDQNLELSLAAYNAGPNTVRRYEGIPPYPETVNYIDRVLKHYRNHKSEVEAELEYTESRSE